MLLKDKCLLKKCLQENRRIPSENLAKLTWGNYSLVDRKNSVIYIKPSGLSLSSATEDDIAIVNLADGRQLAGKKCSIDTNIHLEIYRNISWISSICHTHSCYASAYAQAKRDIPVYGTTHADTFAASIRNIEPPLDIYNKEELHELELGTFISKSLTQEDTGGILVYRHGPFAWSTGLDAVDIAVALEEIAKMSYITESLGMTKPLESQIKNFHWDRKHGAKKRYGQ